MCFRLLIVTERTTRAPGKTFSQSGARQHPTTARTENGEFANESNIIDVI